MLNRTVATSTILERPFKGHKKVYLSSSSSFVTNGYSSASFSSIINNTDAISLEAQECVVSQSQKSSYSSVVATETTVHGKSNLEITAPDSSSPRSHIREKLSWKSRAHQPTDYHCFYKKKTPKLVKSKMMNHLYYLSACFMAICALSLTTMLARADGNLQENLKKLKVSPDLIGSYDDAGLIKVDLHGAQVKPGDVVPVKHFKELNLAKISWDVSDMKMRHTLLLVDLDRKIAVNGTPSIYNQYTNLNIPGNVINTGQTIVAFDIPTVPCQPSSKHRLLLLAYKQDGDFIDLSSVAHISASSGQSQRRENFKLADFLKQFKLELVAANVFSAIGETNGTCSGSASIHSIQSLSSILIAMVILIPAYNFYSRRTQAN